MPFCLRPVAREHATAHRVLFNLPECRTKPRPLESKLETADTAEERADGERHARPQPSSAYRTTLSTCSLPLASRTIRSDT